MARRDRRTIAVGTGLYRPSSAHHQAYGSCKASNGSRMCGNLKSAPTPLGSTPGHASLRHINERHALGRRFAALPKLQEHGFQHRQTMGVPSLQQRPPGDVPSSSFVTSVCPFRFRNGWLSPLRVSGPRTCSAAGQVHANVVHGAFCRTAPNRDPGNRLTSFVRQRPAIGFFGLQIGFQCPLGP